MATIYFKIQNMDKRASALHGGMLPRLSSLCYGTNTANLYTDHSFICGYWYKLNDYVDDDKLKEIIWSHRFETVVCLDVRNPRSLLLNDVVVNRANNSDPNSWDMKQQTVLDANENTKTDEKNDNGYWGYPFGSDSNSSINISPAFTSDNKTYYYTLSFTDNQSGLTGTVINPYQLDYSQKGADNHFRISFKETDADWQDDDKNGFYDITPDTTVTVTNIGKNNFNYDDGTNTGTLEPNKSITFTTFYNGVMKLTPTKSQPTEPTEPTQEPTEPTQEPTEPTQPAKTQNKSLVLPQLPTGVDSITAGYNNVSSLKYGSETNCIVTLNHNYKFKDEKNLGSGLIYTDENGKTVILGKIWGTSTDNENNTTFHLQIDLSNLYDDTIINNLRYDFNIEKYIHNDDKGGLIPITAVLKHCTISPQKVAENDETKVTITADDGYILDSDITYYSYNQNYVSYVKDTQKVQKQTSVTININASSLYDYEHATNHNYNDEPVIIATATLKGSKPTGQANGKLYNISDGQLQSVMNTVIEEWKNSGSDSDEEDYDFTQFVNQVYKIPFNVPQNIQNPVTNILAGNTTVKADAYEITNSIFNVSCGTIKIPLHYNNSHDYEPTKVILNLPYLKEISLNADDVINKTISINYQLDLNSGLITVLISNDNGSIYSQQQNIKTDLSTYAINYNRIVTRPSSIFLNNIRQAYILITYRKPLLNLKTYQTNETGKLKDFKGLTKANNAKINFNLDSWEQNQLNSILNQGVFINDVTSD